MAIRVLYRLIDSNVNLIGFKLVISPNSRVVRKGVAPAGVCDVDLATTRDLYNCERFENLRIGDDGSFSGTECCLTAFPTINMQTGDISLDNGYYVLGYAKDLNKYKLMDTQGNITWSTLSEVISLVSSCHLINAYISTTGGASCIALKVGRLCEWDVAQGLKNSMDGPVLSRCHLVSGTHLNGKVRGSYPRTRHYSTRSKRLVLQR